MKFIHRNTVHSNNEIKWKLSFYLMSVCHDVVGNTQKYNHNPAHGREKKIIIFVYEW